MYPTHKVSFYGVCCYFNNETGDLWGVNRLCDYLILAVTWMHNFTAWCFPGAGGYGFPFKIIEEYND